ncbi:uncharacterized protein LOC135709726 [Ochlerotatus camptorhynchus]|uniref:uncharacterized protein LOC135709726 n=1 Tax=Ochlerotatus camptorhynchus TaxID=644619 RepID=UPI0031CE2130
MAIFCRICRMQIFSQPILLTNNSVRHAKPINEMIFECTQILLTKDIRLPQFLCESCLMRLDEAFSFLKLCRESERMLTQTLPITVRPQKTAEVIDITQIQSIEPPRTNDKSHNDSMPVKLELEPEELTVAVDYATSSTFSAYNVLIGGGHNVNPKGEKDWLSEARKHRERQRISTAKRRAKMTCDQREKERERARIRQAQRRACRSEDEIRAQRERDRIRQAMKRARFRHIEMMQTTTPPQHQQQHQQQQQHEQHHTFPLGTAINQLMG